MFRKIGESSIRLQWLKFVEVLIAVSEFRLIVWDPILRSGSSMTGFFSLFGKREVLRKIRDRFLDRAQCGPGLAIMAGKRIIIVHPVSGMICAFCDNGNAVVETSNIAEDSDASVFGTFKLRVRAQWQ